MHAHGDGVVRQVGILRRLQQQVAQLVGCIGAVGLLTADGPVVPLGHAGVLRAVGLAGHAVDLHHLHAHDLQELEHLFVGDAALVDVLAIEGIHVLIETAGGGGRARADHQEGEPEALHGLAEGLGRLIGHLAADARHLAQLGRALLVLLLVSQLVAQHGVAVGKADPRLKDDDGRFPEVALFNGVDALIAQLGETLFGLLNDAARALVEDAGKVHRHQGEARSKAIAGHGEAAAGAAGAVLPRGQDDAGLHERPEALALAQALAHGLHQVAVGGVAGKALIQAVQLFLVLRGDGIDLALEALHLVLGPHAILVLHLQAERLGGAGAAQQVVRLNEDGDVVQDVGVQLGAAQKLRLAAGLLKGLVRQTE